MPVSKEFERRVLGSLCAVAPVTAKRMFGGVGLYVGGPMFGILDDDRLFFKVDGETVGAYDDAGAEPWVYDPEVGPVTTYREVPRFVLEDPAALGQWVADAAAAAVRLAAKPRRGSR